MASKSKRSSKKKRRLAIPGRSRLSGKDGMSHPRFRAPEYRGRGSRIGGGQYSSSNLGPALNMIPQFTGAIDGLRDRENRLESTVKRFEESIKTQFQKLEQERTGLAEYQKTFMQNKAKKETATANRMRKMHEAHEDDVRAASLNTTGDYDDPSIRTETRKSEFYHAQKQRTYQQTVTRRFDVETGDLIDQENSVIGLDAPSSKDFNDSTPADAPGWNPFYRQSDNVDADMEEADQRTEINPLTGKVYTQNEKVIKRVDDRRSARRKFELARAAGIMANADKQGEIRNILNEGIQISNKINRSTDVSDLGDGPNIHPLGQANDDMMSSPVPRDEIPETPGTHDSISEEDATPTPVGTNSRNLHPLDPIEEDNIYDNPPRFDIPRLGGNDKSPIGVTPLALQMGNLDIDSPMHTDPGTSTPNDGREPGSSVGQMSVDSRTVVANTSSTPVSTGGLQHLSGHEYHTGVANREKRPLQGDTRSELSVNVSNNNPVTTIPIKDKVASIRRLIRGGAPIDELRLEVDKLNDMNPVLNYIIEKIGDNYRLTTRNSKSQKL